MSGDTLFPENPTHGMLYQQKNGVVYQYDVVIKSWLKITSDDIIAPLATSFTDGMMTAADLQKLNRLLIPPPTSSIVGTDCIAAYKHGVIGLYSGDKFISVDGNVEIQNINNVGDNISENIEYQIHQHTYGYDFTLDVPQLIAELEKRGQIRLTGKNGPKGDTGEQGEPGINGVLSGPPGDVGLSGTAPDCTLSVEPETVLVEPKYGLKRAIVGAKVIPDAVDNRNYKLQFDRQVVGNTNGYTSQFKVKQIESTWLLAVASLSEDNSDNLECGAPGERDYYALYYIDIEPILNTIHSKFIDEVTRLKKGYEDIVSFWIQTMSDLFDEQKRALCSALENCMSMTKSIHAREHMESVASTALGKAKIVLHGRDSKEAVEVSSTNLLPNIGHPDLCNNGSKFPERGVPEISKSYILDIDPLLNSAISNAKQFELPQGEYIATIKNATAQINNMHRSNVKIRYISDGERKTIQFLDKGSFSSAMDAQSAYEGLTLSFKHDGGQVEAYLPSIQPRQASGQIVISIDGSDDPAISIPTMAEHRINACQMSASHLSWYSSGWLSGRCCGVVINISGQDYIIVKRSIGTDDSCGGGESSDNPCISQFEEHPAFAWPTFDGQTFADIPNSGTVSFQYDNVLSQLVLDKIENEHGDLSDKFAIVLFPSVS